MRHELEEDLGRQVAEEVEPVGSPKLAEAANALRDVLRAGIHVRPEDERLSAELRNRLERLVDLVEAVAVLGGHWMLHDKDEIAAAIREQLAHGPYDQSPLFGDGTAGRKIAELLAGARPSVQKHLQFSAEQETAAPSS